MEQQILAKILTLTEETNANVKTLQKDVVELKERVTALEQRVSNLEKDVAILKQDVATLKQDVVTLKQDVKDIQNNMIAMEDKIMRKLNAEVKDAVKDHVFMIKNLSNVLTHLQLEIVN